MSIIIEEWYYKSDQYDYVAKSGTKIPTGFSGQILTKVNSDWVWANENTSAVASMDKIESDLIDALRYALYDNTLNGTAVTIPIVAFDQSPFSAGEKDLESCLDWKLPVAKQEYLDRLACLFSMRRNLDETDSEFRDRILEQMRGNSPSLVSTRLCECGSESVGSSNHSSWCPKV